MDKLPNELLCRLFANLNFFEKQEYMLVCRRWSNLIRSTSLFSSIFISTEGAFDSLIRILDDHPSYRPQVHTLIIKEYIVLDLKKQQLVDYFPNLRYIQTGYFTIKRNTYLDTNTGLQTDLENWINQIEIIERHSRLQLRNFILMPGVYPGLKKLSINGFYFSFDWADLLSSAPNISNLVLTEARMSLNNLDELNRGLRFLDSLTLNKLNLIIGRQPNNTIAENLLRTLDISLRDTADDLAVKWLQYISNNYLQLVDFRFIFPWTSSISLRRENEIVFEGLIPLLRNIGDQLQRLDITCSDGLKHVLQTLRVSEHAFRTLHLNTMISAVTRPFQYLGDLGSSINQLTVTLVNALELKKFNFSELKMLKKLRIIRMVQNLNGYQPLSLSELLDSCPDSLDSLEIYGFTVQCSYTDCHSHSLRKLTISSSKIGRSVYSFISKYLPSLKHLTLDQGSSIFISNIVLESKDLDYLEISQMEHILLLITILNNGVSKYYRVGEYKGSGFNSTELNSIRSHDLIKWEAPNSENFTHTEKVTKLICNSVKTLVINKKLAF